MVTTRYQPVFREFLIDHKMQFSGANTRQGSAYFMDDLKDQIIFKIK